MKKERVLHVLHKAEIHCNTREIEVSRGKITRGERLSLALALFIVYIYQTFKKTPSHEYKTAT